MDKKQTKTNLPPSTNYKYVLLSESNHRGNFLEYIFLKKKKKSHEPLQARTRCYLYLAILGLGHLSMPMHASLVHEKSQYT